MSNLWAGLLLVAAPAAAGAEEAVYEGTWVTTNRPLDSTLTCAVTDLGDNRWRGHFYGVWQGVEFSYKVEFRGPPEKLRGTARIDGADYEWAGEMRPGPGGSLKGTFRGNRYLGSFTLKYRPAKSGNP
jgi:hypothetical protein